MIMKKEAGIRYVLYKYQPSLTYYFEQTDILEVKVGEAGNVDLDDVLEAACEKNYCSPEEIKVINIFQSREELDQYLMEHDLRYLA
jgi:hypothetical protein